MLLIVPVKHLVGVGIQANLGLFAQVYIGQIVLKHIAQNPDIAQVGNGEGIRRSQALHACCVRYLLVGDHSRDRRADVDDVAGMIQVRIAEHAKFLGCGLDVDLGFVLGVLRDLQIVQRNGAALVQLLGALQLCASQLLIGHGFSGSRKKRPICPRFAPAATPAPS